MLVVAFPASIALMGVTRDITTALNPQAIRSVIVSMGGGYYVLVAVCAALLALVYIAPGLGFVGRVPLTILQVWALLSVSSSAARLATFAASLGQHGVATELRGEPISR